MIKKILAIVLALLMVLAVFAGCGKKKTNADDETSDGAKAETTTAAVEDEGDGDDEGGDDDDDEEITVAPGLDTGSQYDDMSMVDLLDENNFIGADIPEDRDYGGYQFQLLADTTNVNKEFLAESDGDVVKDGVVARQEYIEQFVNITINITEAEGGYNNMEGYAAEIQNASGAGNPFDLALAYNLIPPVVAAKGLSKDLASSTNLNLKTTTKEYWGQQIKEEIMIGGRIFWMSDNSSWNNIRNMLCMYVNTALFAKNNDGATKDELYDLVYTNQWTMDALLALIQESYENTNQTEGENAAGVDDFDTFGLQAAESSAWLDNWFYAAGFRYTSLNAKGTYDWTLGNAPEVNFINWWHEKLADGNIDKTDGAQYRMFKDERAMFSLSTVGMTEQKLEFDFTVLPLPFYNKDIKEGYSTPFSNTYSSWLIPKAANTEAFERSATVLELLAAEANRRLAPRYFEVQLKRSVGANDPDMQKMFNIIRNSIVFDLGYLYGSSLTVEDLNSPGSYLEVFINLRRIWAGTGTSNYSNVTTVWQKIGPGATTKLNNLMVDILDY